MREPHLEPQGVDHFVPLSGNSIAKNIIVGLLRREIKQILIFNMRDKTVMFFH